MSDYQPKQKGFFEKLTDFTSLVFVGTEVGQLPATVFTRKHYGSHAFRWTGPLCLLYLLLFASLGDVPEVILFIPVWLVMLVWRRIWPDREMISFYQGYPWLTGRFLSEGKAKTLEGLLVGGLGYWLTTEQVRFGYLLLASGWCIVIHEGIEREAIRSRLRKMKDAEKMQRYIMDEYKR